jgi:3-oxoacyl-[acyl-carrier-protein] synthase II
MSAPPRVVVTGLGMATALGLSVAENWDKACRGETGIGRLPDPADAASPIQAAGSVSAADRERIARAFPAAAAGEERRTLFALWAAAAALHDAGLPSGHPRGGVALGAGLGVIRMEDVVRALDPAGAFDAARFGAELDRLHPESQGRHGHDRAAACVAARFGLGGPPATVTTACASAAQAIGAAWRTIRRNDAPVMLAGGADSMIHPVGLVYFVLLGAAATGGDDPATLCRPFDRRRGGLVMGEGAGVVVLESEAHARERGATIYAELAGYASSMDAYRATAPDPEGRGAAQAMRGAEDIDYVNAHGTGTKLNDAAETLAIKALFGPHAARLAVSSSKPLFGHLLAACGGPEFILTVLSVTEDTVHPTLNLARPDPKCDLDYVPGAARRMTVRAALSNNFGFGGQNACLAVRKYQPAQGGS